MRSVCQEPRNLINPVLCLWDLCFNADSRWENSFLGFRENNAAPLWRSRLRSTQRCDLKSWPLPLTLSQLVQLINGDHSGGREVRRSSKIVSRVTSDMAGVGDGKRRKDIFIFLMLNVHYQGSSLNVSEVIGAPRRHFAKAANSAHLPQRG